jgi:hypothetical protein
MRLPRRADSPWRRRLAAQLLDLAARLLPPERRAWSAAMRAEALHLGDREALAWALGSVRAGLALRLSASASSGWLSLRAVSVLWMVMFLCSSAFNLAILVAARLRLHAATAALGVWFEGFHYDRFLEFADAIPALLLLWLALVALAFGVALRLGVRRHPAAFTTFAAAAGMSLLAWLYELSIPAYATAASANHRLRIGICFAMTAAILALLRPARTRHA